MRRDSKSSHFSLLDINKQHAYHHFIIEFQKKQEQRKIPHFAGFIEVTMSIWNRILKIMLSQVKRSFSKVFKNYGVAAEILFLYQQEITVDIKHAVAVLVSSKLVSCYCTHGHFRLATPTDRDYWGFISFFSNFQRKPPGTRETPGNETLMDRSTNHCHTKIR